MKGQRYGRGGSNCFNKIHSSHRGKREKTVTNIILKIKKQTIDCEYDFSTLNIHIVSGNDKNKAGHGAIFKAYTNSNIQTFSINLFISTFFYYT